MITRLKTVNLRNMKFENGTRIYRDIVNVVHVKIMLLLGTQSPLRVIGNDISLA